MRNNRNTTKKEINGNLGNFGRLGDAAKTTTPPKLTLSQLTKSIAISRDAVNFTHSSNYDIDIKGKPYIRYTHLTQAESRLLFTLATLLYLKNKTDEKGRIILSSHNLIETHYGTKVRNTAMLKTTPAELCKEYTGRHNPSSKEKKNILKTLKKLATTRRVISWTEDVERGKKRTVKEQTTLIKLLTPEAPENGKHRKTLKIILSPLFIGNRYVLRPRDIEIRTQQIAGKDRITTAITRLRDYLLTFLSTKKYYTEMGEIRLIYRLGLERKYQKYGANSKEIQAKIKEALRVSKELKIIKKHTKETSKNGETKYCIELNENFFEDYRKSPTEKRQLKSDTTGSKIRHNRE